MPGQLRFPGVFSNLADEHEHQTHPDADDPHLEHREKRQRYIPDEHAQSEESEKYRNHGYSQAKPPTELYEEIPKSIHFSPLN